MIEKTHRLHDACLDVVGLSASVESFECVKVPLSADAGVIRGRRLVLLRVPDFDKFPDGDAMNGFSIPTAPSGLVARFTHLVMESQEKHACDPSTASAPAKRRGDKLKVVFSDPSQLTSLLRIRRRGVSVPRDVPALAAQRPRRLREYPMMVPVLLPSAEKVLNSVADGVGAANEENKLQMLPYLSQTLARVAAAVSIQSTFRAYLCRKRMRPSIAERVLWTRAAVCVQRANANHTRKLRVFMYAQVKEMLNAIGRKTVELEVTSDAMGKLVAYMQSGPRQIFTEQKYMYAFDPYENVYTCRLPAGFPSAGARVDAALDRGVPKWIGVNIPHAPVEVMKDLDPDETETVDSHDLIPMLTANVETVDAPDEDEGPRSGPPARLMRFETNDEARRRAALIFIFTWDPHVRTGVRLLPAREGNFNAVVVEEARKALVAVEVDEAEERRKEKLKRFPPGSPMIPYVDRVHDPDAKLFPHRPSTKGSLTMMTDTDVRDLHGTSRRGRRRQPRRRRAEGSRSPLAGGYDTEGGYSTAGGYSTGGDDGRTTATTTHPERAEPLPFFIPHGARRPDPRYSLGYASDGGEEDVEYFAGGVGAAMNALGAAADQWGSLGMGLDFAPKAHSRAETWLNDEVKATLAGIQREERKEAEALIAERAAAEVTAKKAAIAASTYAPSVRRSSNTANMSMITRPREGPNLTHAQKREALEEMRAALKAEQDAKISTARQAHRDSMAQFKKKEQETKSVLRKAGAVARRERLHEVEAARGAAGRLNRWSVVVERHRALRKAGRADERVFAASFGRQQAALSKQIASAELRHRGSMNHGHATAAVAAAREEEAERVEAVRSLKKERVEHNRDATVAMQNDLEVAKELVKKRFETEANRTREMVVAGRDRRKELKKAGKRAPDRDVLKMTKVSSAT